MIGFLDMAASEIPLVDGVRKTSQEAFQNIFQLKIYSCMVYMGHLISTLVLNSFD